MELDLIINKLNLKYFISLQYFLSKNEMELEWLDKLIKQFSQKNQDDNTSKTLTTTNYTYLSTSSKTENHKQIFSDQEFYKRPWVKLNLIHKILKIKEFVNNLKINSEKDRTELKEELITLVKTKILTKKEKVEYDEVRGKIISLINLEYKNEKYYHYIK